MKRSYPDSNSTNGHESPAPGLSISTKQPQPSATTRRPTSTQPPNNLHISRPLSHQIPKHSTIQINYRPPPLRRPQRRIRLNPSSCTNPPRRPRAPVMPPSAPTGASSHLLTTITPRVGTWAPANISTGYSHPYQPKPLSETAGVDVKYDRRPKWDFIFGCVTDLFVRF